jgi:group I intron endonuclease
LNRAFNKYGFDNFEFTIIDTATTINELNEKEIKYIKEYKSNERDYGYNIESGGKNAIPSPETKKKMSEARKGVKQSDEWINKRIAKAGSDEAKKYGKNKTSEDKKRLSENASKYWLGKTRDEETKRKISQTKKEQGLTENQKKKICKTVYCKNIMTNKIKTYESTAQASKEIGVNQSTISRWCAADKTMKGYVWSFTP